MIQDKDVLSLEYLKKTTFSGSFQGMRYRLEMVKNDQETLLSATIWEEPYSYEFTPKETMETREFPFSGDGITEAVAWLNGRWEEEPDRWKEAKGNWKR